MYLYCATTELKPKYLNVISPFSQTLWIIILLTFLLTWFLLAVTFKIQQLVLKDDGSRLKDSSYGFFQLVGIMFAEYNYRLVDMNTCHDKTTKYYNNQDFSILWVLIWHLNISIPGSVHFFLFLVIFWSFLVLKSHFW